MQYLFLSISPDSFLYLLAISTYSSADGITLPLISDKSSTRLISKVAELRLTALFSLLIKAENQANVAPDIINMTIATITINIKAVFLLFILSPILI